MDGGDADGDGDADGNEMTMAGRMRAIVCHCGSISWPPRKLRSERALGLAVGKTVILLASLSSSILKRLLKGERGSAE